MAESSLKSEIWVKAQIRICDLNALPAVVSRRGDPDAGAVILKLIRSLNAVEVFSQVRDWEGQRAWMRGVGDGSVSERDADDYIAKQVRFDPDLWILEIEDPQSRYVIDGAVI